jgi:hypothetical protein
MDDIIADIQNDDLSDTQLSWNTATTILVQDIGNRAAGMGWIHLRHAQHASIAHRIIGTLNVMFGVTAGTTILAQFGSDSFGILIAAAVFAYVSGLLSGIMTFYSFDVTANVRRSAAARFTAITTEIRLQLVASVEHRRSAEKFINYITHAYSETLRHSPLVSSADFGTYNMERAKRGLIPVSFDDCVDARITVKPNAIKRIRSRPDVQQFTAGMRFELERWFRHLEGI